MPEEEKTSISLTQRLRHYGSGGLPLKVLRLQGVNPNCVYFVSLKLMLLASRQGSVANTSILYSTGWLAPACGSVSHPWVV